jgi:hypothetical protein
MLKTICKYLFSLAKSPECRADQPDGLASLLFLKLQGVARLLDRGPLRVRGRQTSGEACNEADISQPSTGATRSHAC